MKITVEFNNFDEMFSFCKETLGTNPEPPKKDDKPQSGVAPAVNPDPVPPPAPKPVPAPVPAPVKVTLPDVTAKAVQLIDAGRQEELHVLLAKYEVPALPSIPPEKLADFLKDLEALG